MRGTIRIKLAGSLNTEVMDWVPVLGFDPRLWCWVKAGRMDEGAQGTPILFPHPFGHGAIVIIAPNRIHRHPADAFLGTTAPATPAGGILPSC